VSMVAFTIHRALTDGRARMYVDPVAGCTPSLAPCIAVGECDKVFADGY
jgi:hypothetical protein